MPIATVEYWYIESTVNNLNSRVYVEMMNDMRALKNGIFTCTIKINEGIICDYLTVENVAYANPVPPKANSVA